MLTKSGPNRRWIRLSGGCALMFHGVWIGQQMLLSYGQDLSIFNVAALLSLLIGIAVTAAAERFSLWFMLPVVYVCALLSIVLATLLPHHYILQLSVHPQMMLHIGFALTAFTVLMIAALFALQLAYLDRALKRHKPQALQVSLPPLMAIENQLVILIKIGVLLLTLSLLAGFIFLDNIFASGQAHKAILTLIAWGVYMMLLWGRYKFGWRGRTVVNLTLLGALLLMLGYFGSRIVKEIIMQT
jgi:ABC-type uncharacterized transport system permease subunit